MGSHANQANETANGLRIPARPAPGSAVQVKTLNPRPQTQVVLLKRHEYRIQQPPFRLYYSYYDSKATAKTSC